ncbi:hypothetical protein [Agaribacterium sp. ZY112]|uniref:ApeP family dehydratase n=1 Tax=Agaribacterium sp. ZY112 TaxID=3233574 RepID=UPI003525E3A6
MRTTVSFPPIETLIPHEGGMVLIDKVLTYSSESIEVLITKQASSIVALESGEVPAWVGIEYMAQAVSAFAGLRALEKSTVIKKGYLLGSNRYRAYCDTFPAADPLVVKANQSLLDESGVSIFDCQLLFGETVLAEAAIKAIQPEDDELIKRGLS